MSSEDVRAFLQAPAKVVALVALAALGGGSLSVVYDADSGDDPRIAACKSDLDAIKAELASLRPEREIRRLEPRPGDEPIEVSSMAGSGRQ